MRRTRHWTWIAAVKAAALVAGSAVIYDCGAAAPAPQLPAPEYERPSVEPWPPDADGGSDVASSVNVTASDDAGSQGGNPETRDSP